MKNSRKFFINFVKIKIKSRFDDKDVLKIFK